MIRTDGNPWWQEIRDWLTTPLSFPLFLMLLIPCLAIAQRSVHYCFALVICLFISRETEKMPHDHEHASVLYVLSFVAQVACVVYGLVSLW